MKRSLRIQILIAAAILSCACGVKTSVAPAEPFREVTDDLGRVVRVPLDVQRAISLAPNLTENTFAVGAGDRLVGVTTYCNYPAQATSIEKVGDTQTPNVERIIALKPQVVLVSTASQLEAFTRTLSEQNIAVFVTNPTSFDGVLRNLGQLGDIFGTRDTAQALVANLEARVEAVEQRHSSKPLVRVFIQISREPLYTVGRESFLTEIVRRAGGDVVTKDVEKAFPVLSKETALALSPDAIILSDSEDNREPNDAFRNSPAVIHGKVFRVNADIISRPGPRLIDAMEEISRDLEK